MTVDVVLTGPIFLDLTFEGLEELPAPGRERFAQDLHETPGGAAITAVGLSRLGLRAGVLPGPGNDVAGETLRSLLDAEGVVCPDATMERTPVTVVVPFGDERAFITYEPPAPVASAELDALQPRAVVIGLDQLSLASDRSLAYVVVGDRSADLYAQALPPDLGRAHAVFANRDEAARLTGKPDPGDAALALGEHVQTAVVTCGADGAVAASDGELVRASAPRVGVRDTTGAGDLLVAAYVWGDLEELPLDERLRRAVVYAALSVRTATGTGGAATIEELRHALAALDPGIVDLAAQPASAKEHA